MENISRIDNDELLPVVSVITVCFNAVLDIEATFNSVINCKYPNIEYIVIDGGSNDGTVELIKKYKDNISFWVSEPDEGIYSAMNKGLDKATGDWVININAGDRLLSIPSLDLVKAAKDQALCGRIISENDIIAIPKFNKKIRLLNTLPHQALFYNLRLSNMRYETKYKIVADFAYNLDMYLTGNKIAISDHIVAFHSLEGLSNTNASAYESFKVIKNKLGYLSYLRSYFYRKILAFKYYFNKILFND